MKILLYADSFLSFYIACIFFLDESVNHFTTILLIWNTWVCCCLCFKSEVTDTWVGFFLIAKMWEVLHAYLFIGLNCVNFNKFTTFTMAEENVLIRSMTIRQVVREQVEPFGLLCCDETASFTWFSPLVCNWNLQLDKVWRPGSMALVAPKTQSWSTGCMRY